MNEPNKREIEIGANIACYCQGKGMTQAEINYIGDNITKALADYRTELLRPSGEDEEIASKIQITERTPREIRLDIQAALAGVRALLEARLTAIEKAYSDRLAELTKSNDLTVREISHKADRAEARVKELEDKGRNVLEKVKLIGYSDVATVEEVDEWLEARNALAALVPGEESGEGVENGEPDSV